MTSSDRVLVNQVNHCITCLREHPADGDEEVEDEFALAADEAGEELRNPRQPLDGRHALVVLVHRLGQRVCLVVIGQQPQDLIKRQLLI